MMKRIARIILGWTVGGLVAIGISYLLGLYFTPDIAGALAFFFGVILGAVTSSWAMKDL